MQIQQPASELLHTYTLKEILEISDLEEEDVLLILDNAGVLKRPEVRPL
jgi:hypothetical protein